MEIGQVELSIIIHSLVFIHQDWATWRASTCGDDESCDRQAMIVG